MSDIFTSRLHLKAITVDDAEFYLSLMNCRTWIEFIGDRNVHTVDEARSYITRTMSKQWEELGYGNFIVFKKIQTRSLTIRVYTGQSMRGHRGGLSK